MAESKWPPGLPEPLLEDCSYSSQPNTIRSQMEAGVAKVRRRFTMTPEDVTFSLVLDRAQIQILQEFIEVELRDVLSFRWYDFRRPYDTGLVEYRFKSRPKYAPYGPTLWKTTLDLELVSKAVQGRFDLTDEAGRVIALDASTTIQTGSEGFAPAVVPQVAPSLLTAPVLSGSGALGDALSVTEGTWSGLPVPVITFQWQVLVAGVWTSIGGERLASYTPTDAGEYRCAVSAANLIATVTVYTGSLVVSVPDMAPENAVAPSITGNTALGATLTCDGGVWIGQPTPTLSYQWERFTGGAFIAIAGATSAVYATVYEGDHRCVVTAASTAGIASSPSNAINIGTSQTGPTLQAAPLISGNAYAGSTLYADPGLWTGSGAITHRYQWQVQDASTLDWALIPGATAANYATPAAGAYRCLVYADNAGGTSSAPSNRMAVSDPGAVQAPALDYAPQILGAPTVDAILTATRGVWFANPEPTYAWLWQKWDGSAWQTAPGTANTQTYVPTGSGDYRVRVTATNGQGSATASSPTVTVSGGSAGTGTYTQARLVIDATQGAQAPMVGTLEFRATVGGSKLTGTPIRSSEAGAASVASKAFDTDSATFWQPALVPGTVYVGLMFSSATGIGQVALTAPVVEGDGPYADAAIRSFRVQGWDGTQWVTLKTVTDESAWSPGETRLYTVSGATFALPGAPTGLAATAGDGQATATWTAPASSGDGPVLDYRLTASTGQTATGLTGTSGAIALPNGTAVTLTVAARNAGGYGPESAVSNSVTPQSASTVYYQTAFASNDGNWTLPTGCSIGSGVLRANNDAANVTIIKTLPTALPAGTYTVSFKVTAQTNGNVTPRLGDGTNTYTDAAQGNAGTLENPIATGTKTYTITIATTCTQFQWRVTRSNSLMDVSFDDLLIQSA